LIVARGRLIVPHLAQLAVVQAVLLPRLGARGTLGLILKRVRRAVPLTDFAIRPHHSRRIEAIYTVLRIEMPNDCPITITLVIADLIHRSIAIPVSIQLKKTTHSVKLGTVNQAIIHFLIHALS
jgi:hypothetical protein